MCGIVGYAGFDGAEFLPSMVAAIRHRGPDQCAMEEYASAGLGFARLAIVGLGNGRQPMASNDATVHAIVNGEIYNHKALKLHLQSLGHHFSTHSDSESVVHSYREWGVDFAQRLEGMFGLAIWDERTQQLVLSRDRLGKKPVYWATYRNGIVFASEIKGLLPIGITRDINPQAVFNYLVTDSVPTPGSIFRGIHKLPPGETLTWNRNDGPRFLRFWPERLLISSLDNRATREDWTNQTAAALQNATQQRLMADVPVGVYLSGGVDSMLVAASAQLASAARLQSFTLRFDANSYNEADVARVFAKECGFEHREVKAGDSDLAGAIHDFIEIFDEPLNDPAALAQILLARASSEHVKVALTGDGGDELFYGYQHVPVHEFLEGTGRHLVKRMLGVRKALDLIPASRAYFSLGFKAQRLARGISESDFVARDLAWRGAFTVDSARKILTEDTRGGASVEQLMNIFHQVIKQAPDDSREGLESWSWFYLRSYLLDTVLVKVDRATMAYGIEARSPMLDSRFVETVLRIPLRFKTGRYRNKTILREILKNLAPKARTSKRKHGMGVPTVALMEGPLNEQLRDYSSSAFLRKQGLFDSTEVASLLKDFNDGKRDVRKELWGFLVFQMWFERWASH